MDFPDDVDMDGPENDGVDDDLNPDGNNERDLFENMGHDSDRNLAVVIEDIQLPNIYIDHPDGMENEEQEEGGANEDAFDDADDDNNDLQLDLDNDVYNAHDGLEEVDEENGAALPEQDVKVDPEPGHQDQPTSQFNDARGFIGMAVRMASRPAHWIY